MGKLEFPLCILSPTSRDKFILSESKPKINVKKIALPASERYYIMCKFLYRMQMIGELKTGKETIACTFPIM